MILETSVTGVNYVARNGKEYWVSYSVVEGKLTTIEQISEAERKELAGKIGLAKRV